MLRGWERKEGGKKRRLDLGEIGPEPSVLAKSTLGWGIRLQTSRIAFQPQILCDLLPVLPNVRAGCQNLLSVSIMLCFPLVFPMKQ